MTVTIVPQVTPTSEAPQRSQGEEDYSNTADAWAASITVTTTSWNTSITDFNTAAIEINELAEATEANSNSAVAAANAVTWVTGTNYVVGDGVYSPITLLSYRAKNDQTPSTVDPSLDPTNWKDLSSTLPDQTGEDGKFLQTNAGVESWEELEGASLSLTASEDMPAGGNAFINKDAELELISDGRQLAQDITQGILAEAKTSLDDFEVGGGKDRTYLYAFNDGILGGTSIIARQIDSAGKVLKESVVSAQLDANVAHSVSITYNSTEDVFFVIFSDFGDSDHLKCSIVTLDSDLVVTVNTAITIDANSTTTTSYGIASAYNSNGNYVVVAWMRSGNVEKVVAGILNTGDSTTSDWGAVATPTASVTNAMGVAGNTVDGSFLLCYDDANFEFQAGTVDGSQTITLGSEVQGTQTSIDGKFFGLVFDAEYNTFYGICIDSGQIHGQAVKTVGVVATVIGSGVQLGNGLGTVTGLAAAYDTKQKAACFIFSTASEGHYYLYAKPAKNFAWSTGRPIPISQPASDSTSERHLVISSAIGDGKFVVAAAKLGTSFTIPSIGPELNLGLIDMDSIPGTATRFCAIGHDPENNVSLIIGQDGSSNMFAVAVTWNADGTVDTVGARVTRSGFNLSMQPAIDHQTGTTVFGVLYRNASSSNRTDFVGVNVTAGVPSFGADITVNSSNVTSWDSYFLKYSKSMDIFLAVYPEVSSNNALASSLRLFNSGISAQNRGTEEISTSSHTAAQA